MEVAATKAMGIILLLTRRKSRLNTIDAFDATKLPNIAVLNTMGTSDYVRNGIVNHSLVITMNW